jgi:hypothetical protein
MKTITLAEFESMAQETANTIVDLNNFYVQVTKWNDNDRPRFSVTFYCKNFNAGGSNKNPFAAIEEAVAMYKGHMEENQVEITIDY